MSLGIACNIDKAGSSTPAELNFHPCDKGDRGGSASH